MSETKTPLRELGLQPRVYRILIHQGIRSVELLADCDEAELRWLRGMGDGAIDDIVEKLARRGLRLHAYDSADDDTYVPERRRTHDLVVPEPRTYDLMREDDDGGHN